MKTTDFKEGDRVIYMPTHALGDSTHEDCETGVVSSTNSSHVFVKFDKALERFGWAGTTAQACRLSSLEKRKIKVLTQG